MFKVNETTAATTTQPRDIYIPSTNSTATDAPFENQNSSYLFMSDVSYWVSFKPKQPSNHVKKMLRKLGR
jgi:hypothetical protein